MKITELSEDKKIYLINMSNKDTFKINGTEKEAILNADTNLINLPNGEVINKSFIVDIKLNYELTKDNVKKLPDKI